MTTTTVVRRLLLALALYVFPAALASPQDYQVIYEVQSQYQRITVLDTKDGFRLLIFDGKFDGSDSIQSAMNLSDRYQLTLCYVYNIMAALPLVEKPDRILILGLGGASMQRYLYRLLPDAKIETVELDPVISKVAASYFFFKEDARQIVHLSDGRKFIEDTKSKYDIIFLDAFSATSIPYTLSTQEFLKAVKARLEPGGIVCANLWNRVPEYPDILKTYKTVFAELHLIKCRDEGNAILVAYPEKTGLTTQSWVNKARAFEREHPTGLDLPRLIERNVASALPDLSSAKVLFDRE